MQETDISPPRVLDREEWPPNYVEIYAWRRQQLIKVRENKSLVACSREYYKNNPIDFIIHWAVTYDPRIAGGNAAAIMPFVLFRRQAEFIQFLHACLKAEAPALCEKSRDMGATWLCCAFSIWLWLYWPGTAIGWGSRKADLVDKIGDPSSIFEKMRIILRNLPDWMLPEGFSLWQHVSQMRILNPATGSVITGEAGDGIGRGGRCQVFFFDEAAHHEHPELVEAALGYNTRIQVLISSVNGPATVFQRKREAGIEWYPGAEAVKGQTNVFVFDWSDHPEKTVEWYERERLAKEREGLSHVFAQEVERNPSAAVVGTIIPRLWIMAAVGAADKLKLRDDGGWCAGLDVADGGYDRNALALRKGIALKDVWEWGARDTGVTTRKVLDMVEDLGTCEVGYDCIGVGSGVKSEINRLNEVVETRLRMRNIHFVPWNAALPPLHPEGHVIASDVASPLNKDFYGNVKAQGWWELRLRFERTYRAIRKLADDATEIEKGFTYDPNELITLPERAPWLQQAIKELTQPVRKKDVSTLKMIIDKTPDEMRSPNMGDAIMMAYWPAGGRRPMVISQGAIQRSRRGLDQSLRVRA